MADSKLPSNYTPPYSQEAERAVLGGIISDHNNFTLISATVPLEPDYFFLDTHARIFGVIQELENQHQPIDLITVGERLQSSENGEEPVSPHVLVELLESCPVAQNLEHYARIIRDRFYQRKIITACSDVIQQAQSPQTQVTSLIESVEKTFLEISNESDTSGGLVPVSQIVESTMKEIEHRIQTEGTLTGVTTGLRDLDEKTGGWQDSDLVILAARPAMGKTALALNWALSAVQSGKKVNFFTLEMSKEQLLERLAASLARVDSNRMRKGDLTEDDLNRVAYAFRELHKYDTTLAIDETPGITLSELRSRCRRYHKEHGVDLIVIDYLQLMAGSAQAQKQGREREVSEISMGLKGLAKELKVPVIALAQLNRGPDSRTDKRPKISDLRESGSMEQDADMICFVYRDEYYNPNSEDAGKGEIIIGKNRHGETGTVMAAYLGQFLQFVDLAPDA